VISLNQLEVIITKLENLEYKASSNLFPRCVGQGKTEKEALKKLSSAISRFIAKNLKVTLEQTLCSDNYTQIILNTTEKEKKEHRVFSFDQLYKSMSKQVSLKIKSSLNIENFKEQLNQNEDLIGDFSERELYQMLGAVSKEEDFSTVISKATPDGMIFGLPISFN
jgi:predicted RNase H-like HicB family nuclease